MINARATNCARALTGTTQVGVKSVTFHYEYLDGEGDVDLYISYYILYTFLIATKFSHHLT